MQVINRIDVAVANLGDKILYRVKWAQGWLKVRSDISKVVQYFS